MINAANTAFSRGEKPGHHTTPPYLICFSFCFFIPCDSFFVLQLITLVCMGYNKWTQQHIEFVIF